MWAVAGFGGGGGGAVAVPPSSRPDPRSEWPAPESPSPGPRFASPRASTPVPGPIGAGGGPPGLGAGPAPSSLVPPGPEPAPMSPTGLAGVGTGARIGGAAGVNRVSRAGSGSVPVASEARSSGPVSVGAMTSDSLGSEAEGWGSSGFSGATPVSAVGSSGGGSGEIAGLTFGSRSLGAGASAPIPSRTPCAMGSVLKMGSDGRSEGGGGCMTGGSSSTLTWMGGAAWSSSRTALPGTTTSNSRARWNNADNPTQ